MDDLDKPLTKRDLIELKRELFFEMERLIENTVGDMVPELKCEAPCAAHFDNVLWEVVP